MNPTSPNHRRYETADTTIPRTLRSPLRALLERESGIARSRLRLLFGAEDSPPRALLARKSRAVRSHLALLAAGDAAYFQLDPPRYLPGEVCGSPDFVGIGAQRAGTSWWFSLLMQHPSLYHRPYAQIHKERHFFSHYATADFDSSDAQRYALWFPRLPGTITGEWTPDYLYYAWVPMLLSTAAPQARLLVMLRDPVDRFLSGATHNLTLNRHSSPPADILQDALARGFYAAQLAHWLDYFPADQMLVLQFERCLAETDMQLARTFAFLGVEKIPLNDTTRPVNKTVGRKLTMDQSARDRLVDFYSHDVERLAALVPDLDLALWANFAPAARRSTVRAARTSAVERGDEEA